MNTMPCTQQPCLLYLTLTVLVLVSSASTVVAIELPCTACKAVAAELQRRMDTEKVKNHLDMRHRLDSQGQRYGKVIDYKKSELRAVELLDDLCKLMKHYTVVTVNKNSTGKRYKRWAKVSGDGLEYIDAANRPQKNEEEVLSRRLESYCGSLIEDSEDDLYQAIQGGVFDQYGVEAYLCGKLVKACPVRKAEASETAESPAVQLDTPEQEQIVYPDPPADLEADADIQAALNSESVGGDQAASSVANAVAEAAETGRQVADEL